jgi:hypothetical protein
VALVERAVVGRRKRLPHNWRGPSRNVETPGKGFALDIPAGYGRQGRGARMEAAYPGQTFGAQPGEVIPPL